MLKKSLVPKHWDKLFMAKTQKLQWEEKQSLTRDWGVCPLLPSHLHHMNKSSYTSWACTVWACSSPTSDPNNHPGMGGSSRTGYILRRRACIAGLLSLPRLCLQRAWMLVFATTLLSAERSKHTENTALTAGNTDPVDSKQASTDNNEPQYSHSYQPSIRHQNMFCFSFSSFLL